MYDYSCYYALSQQCIAEDLINFSSSHIGNCFATELRFTIKESFEHVVNTVVRCFGGDPKIKCYDPCTAVISDPSLMVILEDDHNHHTDLWKVYDRSVLIRCHGDRASVRRIIPEIKNAIPHDLVPSVSWEFITREDRRSQYIQILPAKPIYPEFYPWLGDVHTYFDEYLASESSILVILGETGTSKTSFVRSLIWYAQLNTMFTYEESLLGSDSLFVDFIVHDQSDLLVVEDADLLLTDREHDGNKVMSKFLNVSDGLANIGKKKIIFTANITDPGRIDPAMLRPGRCFDCQVFRRLSYQEACAAAAVAGLPEPQKQQSYTLAELFAGDKIRRKASKIVGFKA